MPSVLDQPTDRPAVRADHDHEALALVGADRALAHQERGLGLRAAHAQLDELAGHQAAVLVVEHRAHARVGVGHAADRDDELVAFELLREALVVIEQIARFDLGIDVVMNFLGRLPDQEQPARDQDEVPPGEGGLEARHAVSAGRDGKRDELIGALVARCSVTLRAGLDHLVAQLVARRRVTNTLKNVACRVGRASVIPGVVGAARSLGPAGHASFPGRRGENQEAAPALR